MIKLMHSEKGQVMPIVAIALLLIVAMLVTVLAVQDLTIKRNILQNAADAGALAGANIQCMGKMTIGVIESIIFVRDLIITVLVAAAVIFGIISCIPFGQWAIPLAEQAGQWAITIDQDTRSFRDGMKKAIEASKFIFPIYAVANSVIYCYTNGAIGFGIPIPIVELKSEEEAKNAAESSATASQIDSDPNNDPNLKKAKQLQEQLKIEITAAAGVPLESDGDSLEAAGDEISGNDIPPVTGGVQLAHDVGTAKGNVDEIKGDIDDIKDSLSKADAKQAASFSSDLGKIYQKIEESETELDELSTGADDILTQISGLSKEDQQTYAAQISALSAGCNNLKSAIATAKAHLELAKAHIGSAISISNDLSNTLEEAKDKQTEKVEGAKEEATKNFKVEGLGMDGVLVFAFKGNEPIKWTKFFGQQTTHWTFAMAGASTVKGDKYLFNDLSEGEVSRATGAAGTVLNWCMTFIGVAGSGVEFLGGVPGVSHLLGLLRASFEALGEEDFLKPPDVYQYKPNLKANDLMAFKTISIDGTTPLDKIDSFKSKITHWIDEYNKIIDYLPSGYAPQIPPCL